MRTQQGTTGLIEQPDAVSFSIATGWQTVRRWKGEMADCKAASYTYAAGGVSFTIEPAEPGKGILSVMYQDPSGGSVGGPDDHIPTVWTLTPSIEQRSILLAPAVKAVIDTLSEAEKQELAQQVADARSNSLTYSPGWTGGNAVLNYVVYDMLAGKDTFLCTYATLRKTRTVSSGTAQTADWDRVMRVWTTAQIIAAEPTIPAAIIGTLETGDWLKQASAIDQMSDGRYTISTEWHYRPTGGWDTTYIYTAA